MDRIYKHPVLEIPKRKEVSYSFDGFKLHGFEGEMISSALIAEGIHVFGHHHRDDAPQGIFCANGQCSQCLVIADGLPVKGCMTPLRSGMTIESVRGKPVLPPDDRPEPAGEIETVSTGCLIVGGGPAGLSAAAELGKMGIKTHLIDDKYSLGGKLTLQTHVFFGSTAECYAGLRGIEIARKLTEEVEQYPSVDIGLAATAAAVFPDGKVGVVREGKYYFIRPKVLVIACGAREKTLAFPGSDLPGVYGAGAFQTLVNRDLVRAAKRLFVCGGGNVGLIAAYHALQAGIEVLGLTEAMEKCGGYKVHEDKVLNAGVPVFTGHTVVEASGKGRVEEVTIARLDSAFKPVPGSERRAAADTLLLAVGLNPIDELYRQALRYGLDVYAAGDADEISEASAAMYRGKTTGRMIAEKLGGSYAGGADAGPKGAGPKAGTDAALIAALRSRPGPVRDTEVYRVPGGVYPVIRCYQEIPCDPCAEVCPKGLIRLAGDPLLGIPAFAGEGCTHCGTCVLACPGCAITLVDERFDPSRERALVTLPYEFEPELIEEGAEVVTAGEEGARFGTGRIERIRRSGTKRRLLVTVNVPFQDRLSVAGIRIQPAGEAGAGHEAARDGDTIICRCERITKREIVAMIRSGCRDMNQIKAALRTGMGACGGKTCEELIFRLFIEEGVDPRTVTRFVKRPPLLEVPLKIFAGVGEDR